MTEKQKAYQDGQDDFLNGHPQRHYNRFGLRLAYSYGWQDAQAEKNGDPLLGPPRK